MEAIFGPPDFQPKDKQNGSKRLCQRKIPKNHLQTDASYRGRSRTFKHKAAVLVYKGQLLLRCNLDLQLLNNMFIGAGTIKTPFPIGSCKLTVILALGC